MAKNILVPIWWATHQSD